MAEAVRFHSQRRDYGWGADQVARLLERDSRQRRRLRRIAKAPWGPVAALIGVAAAATIALDRHPNSIGGSGGFGLCVRSSQQNCVIDGDTIRHGGVTIRLADIDAPETRDPKCASEAARGQRAKHRLLELMNAGSFQVVDAGGRDQDIYARKLRVIERGGRSVAETLVAEGLARPWDGARRSWCG